MTELQTQMRSLLANRNTPEARAFYEKILVYVHRRARGTWRNGYADLLSEAEIDEAVADVLKRLLTGALASFRGGSMPELFAFLRTITDRCVWRLARRKIQERTALEGPAAEEAESWFSKPPHPHDVVERVIDVPLNEKDQDFLKLLLEAESKVEYSRRHGVSRAAVTQRVQRIRARIAALEVPQQDAVDAWLHIQAREHLARD